VSGVKWGLRDWGTGVTGGSSVLYVWVPLEAASGVVGAAMTGQSGGEKEMHCQRQKDALVQLREAIFLRP
jgi:hypothetical protein